MNDGETGDAVFDTDVRYRYLLWRTWDPDLPRVGFIMLNPSSADGDRDDPTLRRCRGFARAWGFGGLGVANLFALRSVDPLSLQSCRDAVGGENERYLVKLAETVDTVVAAWGNGGAWQGRGSHVRRMLAEHPLFCLGVTVQGEPRHPLYVPSAAQLKPLGYETVMSMRVAGLPPNVPTVKAWPPTTIAIAAPARFAQSSPPLGKSTR